jgi:hypothetical protein
MKLTLTWIVVVVVAAAACKKKEPEATGGGSAAKPGGAAPAVAVDAAVPVDDAAPDPTAGLPPFGKAAGADAEKSRQLVAEARRALDGDDEGDPIALSIAAVKADPGSPHARAVLAASVDEEAIALAQLAPLATATAADCPDCADVVRNLAWSETDAIKALAAKVTPSPQRAAAEALVAFLGDGDTTKVAAYFKAPKVAYEVYCSVCDGKEGDTTKKMTGAKLLALLAKQVQQAAAEEMPPFVTGDTMTCAKDCCTVEVGMLQHNHDFFDSVCFAPGTDQITKISITSGG